MISQRGGALIEFVYLTLVMVPLFFALPMIGKLIDLKQKTIQASRYSAWEATVYPSGANSNMPTSVKERFFGDDDNVLVSHSAEPGSNSLWGEDASIPRGEWWNRTDIEIDEASVIGVPYERNFASPGTGFEIGTQASRSGEILDSVSGNEWGLERNGFVRADVTLDIKSNEWLTRAEGACGGEESYTCLNASSVIMSDGWSASSDDQARRRIRSLTPASILEPIGDALSQLGHLPVLDELDGLKNAFGHVDMNVLPPYVPQR